MMKKMIILGMFIGCLSMATCVFAQDVVVTARGSKYHKPECRLVKNKDNTTTLAKKEAIDADYGPCGRCYKEDKVVSEKNDKEK